MAAVARGYSIITDHESVSMTDKPKLSQFFGPRMNDLLWLCEEAGIVWRVMSPSSFATAMDQRLGTATAEQMDPEAAAVQWIKAWPTKPNP